MTAATQTTNGSMTLNPVRILRQNGALFRNRAIVGLAALVIVIPPQRKERKRIVRPFIYPVSMYSLESINSEKTSRKKENG